MVSLGYALTRAASAGGPAKSRYYVKQGLQGRELIRCERTQSGVLHGSGTHTDLEDRQLTKWADLDTRSRTLAIGKGFGETSQAAHEVVLKLEDMSMCTHQEQASSIAMLTIFLIEPGRAQMNYSLSSQSRPDMHHLA